MLLGMKTPCPESNPLRSSSQEEEDMSSCSRKARMKFWVPDMQFYFKVGFLWRRTQLWGWSEVLKDILSAKCALVRSILAITL